MSKQHRAATKKLHKQSRYETSWLILRKWHLKNNRAPELRWQVTYSSIVRSESKTKDKLKSKGA